MMTVHEVAERYGVSDAFILRALDIPLEPDIGRLEDRLAHGSDRIPPVCVDRHVDDCGAIEAA
jgi:hypothetical protein